MAGLVQYYVMKRPKHPLTGEIVRGKAAGATKNLDGSINQGATLWFPKNETTTQANGSAMSIDAPLTTVPTASYPVGMDPVPAISAPINAAQVDGEPWILHSVHFSVDDAVAAAKPVISAVGSENTRILQSIAHEMIIKLA